MGDIGGGSYLDNGLAPDEMRPAPDGHAPVRPVHHILAPLDQPAEVAEPARAVGVGEHGVLPSHVAQAVGHGAALAAVLGELDHAKDVVQPVLAGEGEGDLDGAVAAAVVDDQNLVA
jgi:hypothetical protein